MKNNIGLEISKDQWKLLQPILEEQGALFQHQVNKTTVTVNISANDALHAYEIGRLHGEAMPKPEPKAEKKEPFF